MNVRRLSQARRKEIASLRGKRERDAAGLCLVEGRRAVAAAVAGGATVVEIVVTSELLEEYEASSLVATTENVVVASPKEFDRMSDVVTSQGILAVVRATRAGLEDVAEAQRIVALDGVQDPGNVGTIIRTASWFGVDAIVCGPGVADCYGPKVVRSSMGGVWDLGLVRSDSLASDLGDLRRMGFALYGADLGGASVSGWSPRVPSCLVLGSEAHGLSPDVRSELDSRVSIPPLPGRRVTESLNVAIAAGILFHRWSSGR